MLHMCAGSVEKKSPWCWPKQAPQLFSFLYVQSVEDVQMQQEQIQHLKCSHFSPPRSIWFTAASAVPAALLGCAGCGNGRAHGGRSHRRCRYAGAEERESAKRQREGLRCSCGGRCVNGCRYWKQRGGERRHARSDAACRGRSECGVTVGVGGGQQGCTPLRNLR